MSEMWPKMFISLHVNYPFYCPILMRLEFFLRSSEKYSNINFYENPSSWDRIFPCGQMDGHDEANSLFSYFCERT